MLGLSDRLGARVLWQADDGAGGQAPPPPATPPGQASGDTPAPAGQTPAGQTTPAPQMVDLNAVDDKGQRLYFDRAYVEQLRGEAANHRTLYQQAKAALEATAAPGKDQDKGKGKPDPDPEGTPDSAIQKTLDTLKARERDLLLDNAVLADAAKGTEARARFIDPSDAVRLIDRSTLTIKDDGTIDGVSAALDALATAKPHLLEQQSKRSPKLGATNPGQSGGAESDVVKRIRSAYNGQSDPFGGGGVFIP